MRQVAPYTALSDVYDRVMDHVDYEAWADYIADLIAQNEGRAGEQGRLRVLELGCGTGRFAAELLDVCDLEYTATDISGDMLQRARRRFEVGGYEINTRELDFLRIDQDTGLSGPFDVVLLLYDGFNYLTSSRQVGMLFEGVRRVLSDAGIFVFDQATPANSENNFAFFEDEAHFPDGAYKRKSTYDPERRLHSTEFVIHGTEGTFFEEHLQRIWTIDETRRLVSDSALEVARAYDGYSMDAADGSSERIHWILHKEDSTLSAAGGGSTSVSTGKTS